MADMCVYQNSTPCVGGYALRPPRYYPPVAPWTIRVRMTSWDGYPVPKEGATVTRVFDDMYIYDITYENPDWSNLLESGGYMNREFAEVLEANTTGVTNMSNMFNRQVRLQSLPYFDTSAVTNMHNMFRGCYALPGVPLFDTSAATDMYGMFADCRVLASVPAFDTSSATDMGQMFMGCDLLADVPLFDTSHVTNMASMFSACYALHDVPLFDTSSAIYMSTMFKDCAAIENAPLINTSHATRLDGMFSGCSALMAVPLYNTSSATNVAGMFQDCFVVERGALALYTQMSAQSSLSGTTSHRYTFKNCGRDTTSGAAELAQIPSGWR